MRISIKIVMATAFALSAIIAAVVAFVPTFIAGNNGITSTVNTLRSTSILATRNGISAFFNKPAAQAEALYYASISEPLWSMANATRQARIALLCHVTVSNPSISAASIVSPLKGDDYFQLCDGRNGNDALTAGFANISTMSIHAYIYPLRMLGPLALTIPYPGFALVADPAYVAASQAGPVWLPAILGYDRAQFSVQFGYRDASGNLEAIVLTVLPDALNSLVAGVGLRKRARAFIADRNTSYVVGNSWGEQTVVMYNYDLSLPPAQRGKLSTPEDLQDPLVKDTISFLGGNNGFFDSSTPIERSFDGPDGKTFVDVDAVSDQYGLSLRFLVAMPELDFLEETNKQRDATIGGVVAAIVVILILAVVFAIVLARPLDNLGHRMYMTATLQDSGEDDESSSLSEIADMQTAYITMRSELNRMKSYLPQSLMAGGNDEDDEEESEIASSSVNTGRSGVAHSDAASERSRRSSKNSSVQNSSLRGVPVVAALNTRRNAVNKRVTVAVFNALNTHHLTKSGAQEFTIMQNKLLTLVSGRVRDNKGVIDVFQGDHVIVTFNAVNNVASAGKRAALACIAVASETKEARLTITAGISSSGCLVGNMGTDDMQRFNIVGPAFVQAIHLEREAAALMRSSEAAKARNSLVLASDTVMADAALEIYHQVVDIKVLPAAANPTPIAALEDTKSMATEEWMYQLQEGENADPYAALNGGFQQVAARDKSGASDAFSKASDSKLAETFIGLDKLKTLVENL